jgi:hypothetical protein
MQIRLILACALLTFAACKEDAPTPDAKMNLIDAPAGGVCGMSATVEYLAECTAASECGTCVCNNFGHNMRCTVPCTSDTDCPAPSAGCQAPGPAMRFCRL